MFNTKINCFTENPENLIPLYVYTRLEFSNLSFDDLTLNWIKNNNFDAQKGQIVFIPNFVKGTIESVIVGAGDKFDCYYLSRITEKLKNLDYKLLTSDTNYKLALIMFALKNYLNDSSPRIYFKDSYIKHAVDSSYLARDLINTPANILGPYELANKALITLKKLGADCKIHENLEKTFPAIHAVGKASIQKPLLFEATYGNKNSVKVCLIGKGITFDTGGLNLKNASGMRLMKKDMAGAAQVIGLAKLIIKSKLDVYLKILIPCAENSLGSNSQRPGDIITMKNGMKVEVDNTDAEGRLVLADAISYASQENFDYMFTIASLTGASSMALAPNLPALFSRNDKLANEIVSLGFKNKDPLWQLPLFDDLQENIESNLADIKNATSGFPYGGAITAALFLEKFITNKIDNYVHIDAMCWNVCNNLKGPKGGEAMSIRAIHKFLEGI